jgi:hypothetical protein
MISRGCGYYPWLREVLMSNSHSADRRPLRSIARFVAPVAAAACVLGAPALASAQIKSPGAHPKYSVELEPHFIIDWNDHNGPDDDEALGLGMRATIPFLDNGPISTINNNMGIGFGLDYAWNDNACNNWRWRNRFWNDNCSWNVFYVPVVVQWNFWLTPIVSVFGEAGLAIERTHWEVDGCCEDSDTDLEFLFWGGGRFLFGANSSVGAVVRLGWPYISLGIGILI